MAELKLTNISKVYSGNVEVLRRQPVTDGHVACGDDVADGEADQRQAQDPARDLAPIHG